MKLKNAIINFCVLLSLGIDLSNFITVHYGLFIRSGSKKGS